MKESTSFKWEKYAESLVGERVTWTGWVTDASEQWGDGYKVLIDMDNLEGVSVQDVYLVNVSENVAMNLNLKESVTFSGQIVKAQNVLSSCAVTLEDVNF